ncbi:MAG: response regulator [Nitrospirae bacterium]|nr:response regulator [Nitrospirota bacterium]
MDNRPIRFLLIEDNPGDVMLIRAFLIEAGAAQFEMEHVDRLFSGLERLKERRFDCLLLDLGLPDSQGLETLTSALSRNRDLPIIVLTGLADETTGMKAVQEGAQDYLVKGEVSGRLLVSSMRYAIERNRIEERLHRSNRALRVLSECNQTLIRATEEMDFLRKICRIIVTDGGYRLAWIGFAGQDQDKTVHPVASTGCEEGYLETVRITWGEDERSRGPTGTAIRTGRPVVCKNVATDPDYEPWRADAARRGYGSTIALPLIGEGRAFGALNIYATEPDAFDDEEIHLLTELADDLAYGILSLRARTAHNLTEQALRESGERFRQVVENIREVLWMTDVRHNQMIYISPAYKEIWGRSCESRYASPKSWLDALHPMDRERIMEAALSKQVQGTYEEVYRIMRPDGTLRWIAESAFPVKDESGDVCRIVGIAEDITERKMLEDQLRHAQKMEIIGRLAGGVAHDFNNILTAIIGYANLLQMKMQEDDPLKLNVEPILAASEKAAALTRSLLTFSRKQVFNSEPVNLNDIIRRLERLLLRLIGEEIRMNIALAAEDLVVMADSVQIDQVLMNLVSNAHDAMSNEGLLTITTGTIELDDKFIAVHGYGTPGMYALLSVTDTGTGMDEKTRERLFEPFFTTKFGYTVIEAVDGNEAIQKFIENKDRVQLVILDAIMPRKSGKAVYNEIRKISPGMKALFMSGYTLYMVKDKGVIEEEGDNFLSKPVSPSELLRKVREVLDKA